MQKNNYTEQLRQALPRVFQLMDTPLKTLPLKEYVQAFRRNDNTLQDGEDVIAAAENETRALYGDAEAKLVRRELENRFAVHTANHQGIDFHYEFFQGDLLFALGCRHAVPLFSCGGVPCDNICFPRGIVLSSKNPDSTKVLRIPVLSNAERKIFVSVKDAYTKEQLKSCPEQNPDLSEKEKTLIRSLVQKIYLHPQVLRQTSFSTQMSIANSLTWEKLTPSSFRLPPLINLELLQITKKLMLLDMQNPCSLIYTVLFEPEFTKAIFHALNHQRACWQITDKIEKGTFLFWAVDGQKHSRRLTYNAKKHSVECPQHPELSFALTPETVSRAMQEGTLLPSLYLCFSALTMARGLVCFGGPYQHHYMAAMQNGTQNVLRLIGENAAADKIRCVSPFVTGLMPLQMRYPNREKTFYTGIAEILLAGGIDENLWEQLGSADTFKTFCASLPFHYEEVIAPSERLENWQNILYSPSPLVLSEKAADFNFD